MDWASQFDHIALSYSPVGATADALGQIDAPMLRCIRPYDLRAWPYATAGFFKFKDKIPNLLAAYDRQLSLI